MPSWAAGTPDQRWRNSTTCAAVPASGESLTSSRSVTPWSLRRNSARLARSQPRAAVAASPARPVASGPSKLISDSGVPKRVHAACAASDCTAASCVALGATWPVRRSKSASWACRSSSSPAAVGCGWAVATVAARPPSAGSSASSVIRAMATAGRCTWVIGGAPRCGLLAARTGRSQVVASCASDMPRLAGWVGLLRILTFPNQSTPPAAARMRRRAPHIPS